VNTINAKNHPIALGTRTAVIETEALIVHWTTTPYWEECPTTIKDSFTGSTFRLWLIAAIRLFGDWPWLPTPSITEEIVDLANSGVAVKL
jgi:hypothetical protein